MQNFLILRYLFYFGFSVMLVYIILIFQFRFRDLRQRCAYVRARGLFRHAFECDRVTFYRLEIHRLLRNSAAAAAAAATAASTHIRSRAAALFSISRRTAGIAIATSSRLEPISRDFRRPLESRPLRRTKVVGLPGPQRARPGAGNQDPGL